MSGPDAGDAMAEAAAMNPAAAEKRTVLLLSAAQALFQTSSVIVVTLSGLAGQALAVDKSLATLPMAMLMVAAATVEVTTVASIWPCDSARNTSACVW